ncbi:hypothetical protein [Sulfurovum mangrovi]|uniref:hypothetical protein n=1 Tax=Sulfurovum mangrovi TaxID=2893889 RepID=UPI001E5FCBEE|nr:hypothetical protein [Sulfurovum mangrovi]UFH58135.1 hypothetical protein LN246_07200 [Sulfurovum mangrovi]
MPVKFRIEQFEPKEIEKAQEALDKALEKALDFQSLKEMPNDISVKKSFLMRLLEWFK